MNLEQLRQRLSALKTRLGALNARCEEEDRDFTRAEQKEWDEGVADKGLA